MNQNEMINSDLSCMFPRRTDMWHLCSVCICSNFNGYTAVFECLISTESDCRCAVVVSIHCRDTDHANEKSKALSVAYILVVRRTNY